MSSLHPAPPGFDGGAAFVGSVEMINMQHMSSTYPGSFWNPLTDTELWEDNSVMDSANNFVTESTAIDKYHKITGNQVPTDQSMEYVY